MEARYGDVSGADFTDAIETVQRAQDSFNSLPAKVRKQFNNNPALFLDFVNDPQNENQLIEMGLATRKEIDEIVRPTHEENPTKKEEVTE